MEAGALGAALVVPVGDAEVVPRGVVRTEDGVAATDGVGAELLASGAAGW